MSCHYSILYSGVKGYVICCKECGMYQLAFLSSLINFGQKDFKKFGRQVASRLGYPVDFSDKHKNIVLNTFSGNSQMVLSYEELNDLSQMLEEADVVQQTNALLELFDQ